MPCSIEKIVLSIVPVLINIYEQLTKMSNTLEAQIWNKLISYYLREEMTLWT